MDKNELLKIAREKYPIGTVFKSAYNPEQYPKCVVKNNNFKFDYDNLFTSKDDCIFYADCNKLGKYNTWAEIISTPNKSYELW